MTDGPRVDGRTTDTRRRILAVARSLFETRGFAATSLRDIAEQLGVSKAALYYHFPRKAELVHSVLVPMADDIDAWFDRVEASERSPRELLLDYFDLVHGYRDLIAAIGQEPAAVDTPELAARFLSWMERSQRLIVGPDAPLEHRIRATFAMAGLARTTSFFPDASVDELRTHGVEAALDALGPALADAADEAPSHDVASAEARAHRPADTATR